MTELARFTLLLIGLVYLVTESAIMAPPRIAFVRALDRLHPVGWAWGIAIYCPACTGFWIGAALGAVRPPLPVLWNGPLESAVMAMAIMWLVSSAITHGTAFQTEQQEILDQMLQSPKPRGTECPDDGEPV